MASRPVSGEKGEADVGSLTGTKLLSSTVPLLAWFAESGRDLPWRTTRDPWLILVCELMAQQTQVSRVVERLPRFLEQFPSPTALADERVGAVIQAWTGLGYNRRAVNLHRAAAWNQALMEVGALLCRPKPTCGKCPLQPDCRWNAAMKLDPASTDPAKHSAKVSTKQSKFEGSDRQGRGRLVKALASSSVEAARLDTTMGWPGQGERANQVAGTVIADGLATFDGQNYRLPE